MMKGEARNWLKDVTDARDTVLACVTCTIQNHHKVTLSRSEPIATAVLDIRKTSQPPWVRLLSLMT
jgi:hypothetical protein